MKVIKQLLGLAAVAVVAYGLWVLAVLVLVFWWEGRDPLASCEGQVEHHAGRLYPVFAPLDRWSDYNPQWGNREDIMKESQQWLLSRGYQKGVVAYHTSWRENGEVISHIMKIKTATTLKEHEKRNKIQGVQYFKRHKEAVKAFFEETGDVNLDQWCLDHNALEALREEEAAL